MTDPREPIVIPNTTRRDVIVGVAAAVAVVVAILFGFYLYSGNGTSPYMEGEIVEKLFEPRNETQLIVSRKGAKRREVTGHYFFRVRVPADNDELYDVVVDERVYKTHKVGDTFSFPRPPADAAQE